MTNWQDMFLSDLAQRKSGAEPKPIGFVENIQKGGWGGFADRATFGIKPMIQAGQLYHATKRFQFDDYPRTEKGWNQRLEDKERIVEYLEEQAELSERGLTVPAKVGTVVFDMLPFMAEFVATGGLASLGKAGAKKSILSLARKYTSNQTARIAANVGSTMVSAGIRSALTPQHVAEKYFENRLPEFGVDENNHVILGDAKESPATAIYKAIGDHFIELLSEESGAGIAAMAKGLMPKGVHQSASKLINSVRKAWIKAAPGRDSLAFAKRISEKGGFHGILEEMGEERLGDTLRATFGIEDFGQKDGNVFDRLVASIPDGEQLLVEALAFSVPGVGRAAIAAGHELLTPPQNMDTPADVQDHFAPQSTEEVPPSQPETQAKPQPQDPEMPVTEESETQATPPQPETVAEETSANDKFYAYDGAQFIEMDIAEKVSFPKLDEFEFFVGQKDGIWNVYEAVTGLSIGGNYKQKKRAIEAAGERLAKRTADEVRKSIEAGIDRSGLSPRYPDYAKMQQKPESETSQESPEFADEELIERVIATAGTDSMIEQGDTAEQIISRLKQGQAGFASGGYRSSIGGYINNKKISTDYIIIETPHGTSKHKLADALENYISRRRPTVPQEQPPQPQQPKESPKKEKAPAPKEGQRVQYPDKSGKIITGTVTHTGSIDGMEYVGIKADPEHEIVVGGGIPIGRMETIAASRVKPIEESPKPQPKSDSQTPPKKKSIAENLSADKQDRLAELKKRFQDKLRNQVNMGFDPEMLTITAEMAALYIEAGARTFAQFARTVVGDVGQAFKPYLKSAYLAARNMPGMEEYRAGMDKADYVDDLKEADIDGILSTNDQETDNGRLEPDKLSKLSGGSVASGTAVAEETGTASQDGQTGELSDRDRSASGQSQGTDETGKSGHTERGDQGDHSQPDHRPGKSKVPGLRSGRSSAKPSDGGTAGQIQEGSDRQRVNHRIGPNDVIVPGGAITQVKANIEAIKLLKSLEAENQSATPEQQKTLAQYTGWGNLSQVFHEGYGRAMLAYENNEASYHWRYNRDENWEKKWGKYYKQLKELLTEQEFNAAAASTLNAHYTERGIIESMWKMAERLGFKGGTVLEPGAGVGHFFGLMPQTVADGSKLIGVELDSVSGRILSQLYPNAKTFIKGFEEVNLPPNSVDLVISNFPFAQEGPADAKKRYGQNLNLHNYFFARSIDVLRPGGLVIAITTHHTMDSAISQRKLLASKAELVAAVRLPNTAFKENAGTEVTTDIIILRKPHTEMIGGHNWTRVSEIETVDHKTASINEYFIDNPEMMLGRPSMEGSLYGGKEEFTLQPLDRPLDDSLGDAIAALPEDILTEGSADVDFEQIGSLEGQKENSLVFQNGKLLAVKNGALVPVSEITDKLASAAMKKLAVHFSKLRDTYQQHLHDDASGRCYGRADY
jgi:adenine-specific DNA methylase